MCSKLSLIALLVSLVSCCFVNIINGRIIKPSVPVHEVPNYEPYQLPHQQHQENQQEHEEYYTQQYQPHAHHTATTNASGKQKLATGNYHSVKGHDHQENHDDHHTHPKYKYSYKVEEHKTGDFKQHVEERDGDVVHGEYSLIEADGSLRTIKYTVDDENGFQAIVVKGDNPKTS